MPCSASTTSRRRIRSRSARAWLRSTKFRNSRAAPRATDEQERQTGFGIRDSGFGGRQTGFGIRDSGFGAPERIPNPKSRIPAATILAHVRGAGERSVVPRALVQRVPVVAPDKGVRGGSGGTTDVPQADERVARARRRFRL